MSFLINGGIPEGDLPVKSPSGAANIRYVENGKSYSSSMPDVVAASANVQDAIDGIVADAEQQVYDLMNSLGYLPPVAFSSGLSVDSVRFTVTYAGVTYAPAADALPFTTTSTFNPAQWRVIQGVTASDLASVDEGKGAAMVRYDADETVAQRLDALGNLRADLADPGTGKGADLVQLTPTSKVREIITSIGSSLIGFIQAGTGAQARTVQDKLRDRVSVKDFGAVGDGVTDDGPAFQRAINKALSGVNGGSVYIPAGKYRIETQVSIPIAGGMGKLIYGDGEGTIISCANVSGGVHGLYIGAATASGNSNTTIKHIMFEGGGTTGKCIYLHNANGARIENCYFANASIGVEMTDSYAVRFQSCVFKLVDSYAIVSSTPAHHTTLNNCNFYDCGMVSGTYGTCVQIGGLTDNVVIRDCDFEGNNRVLVSAGGSSCVIEGCYIENGPREMFSFNATINGLIINNNWLSNNAAWTAANISGGEMANNKINAQVITFNASTVKDFDVGNNYVVNGSSVGLSPFTAVTSFQNGYTGSNVGYKRHNDGTVELRGTLTLGSNNNTAFNLPAGYRPPVTMYHPAWSTTLGAGGVIIDANGNVVPGTSGANVVLSGIRFSAQ